MKKLFLIAFAASALASCTNTPKAVITADLANVEDQKIYIKEFINGSYIDTDSASMVGGKFTITTDNVYPRQSVITFEKNNRVGKYIIIEEGVITIKGDFTKLNEASVTGTKTSDMVTAFETEKAIIEKELEGIYQEYRSLDRKTLSEEEINAKQKEIKAKFDESNSKLDKLATAAIEKNSDNVFGAYLTSIQEYKTHQEIEAALAKLSPNMPKNKFIDNLNETKNRLASLEIGQVAPDFTVTTPEGKPISLSSLKGQVVLVDFWASWCGPCRGANPSIVALYNKHKDAGFTVFGVSLDDNKEKWVEAIAADGLTWYHGSDLKGWNAAPAKLYGVSGIPYTVLLDKEGKIVGKALRGKALDAKVDELMASLK